jgi:hypothetical protein
MDNKTIVVICLDREHCVLVVKLTFIYLHGSKPIQSHRAFWVGFFLNWIVSDNSHQELAIYNSPSRDWAGGWRGVCAKTHDSKLIQPRRAF